MNGIDLQEGMCKKLYNMASISVTTVVGCGWERRERAARRLQVMVLGRRSRRVQVEYILRTPECTHHGGIVI